MTQRSSGNAHKADDEMGLLYNIKVFIISAGVLGIMFLIIQWLVNGKPQVSVQTRPQPTTLKQPAGATLSQGDYILLTTSALKNKGAAAISAGDYTAAVSAFKAARQEDISDPEALIYLNNARIGTTAAHDLAVIVPAVADPAMAASVLRGVAQAQTEINQADGIQGKSLRLFIGDDQGDSGIAKEIATQLSQSSDLVGIIGHRSATTTTAAIDIYKEKLLSLISINTAVKPKTYLQPMLSGTSTAAKALAYYMTTLNYRTVALFYDGSSDDSYGFKANFETNYKGNTTEQIDLANLPKKVIEKSPKADVVLLSPGNQSLKTAAETILSSRRRLFGGPDLFSPQTLAPLEGMANNIILAIPDELYQSAASPFSDRPLKLWDTIVDLHATASYNSAQTMISGLKQTPSREGVNQAIASIHSNPNVRLLKVSINDDAATGYEFIPIALVADNKLLPN
ncbi:MAG: ABC transporter substrate-binding protein [Cyanobacteria bacterium P01_F01_bin.13]